MSRPGKPGRVSETWTIILAGAGAAAVVLVALANKAFGWSRCYVRGGRLYGPLGRSYSITDDDLLWLGRCVVGEAGSSPSRRHAAAVIWALAQNLCLVRRTPALPSLTAVARAYSHLLREPTIEWCQAHPDLCDDLRASIRARLAALTWSGLPSTVRACLTDFRNGALENPIPGLTDWASVPYAGGVTNIDGNIFGVSPNRRLV